MFAVARAFAQHVNVRSSALRVSGRCALPCPLVLTTGTHGHLFCVGALSSSFATASTVQPQHELKHFDHHAAERHWAEHWEREQIYRFEERSGTSCSTPHSSSSGSSPPPSSSSSSPRYIVDTPPPTVSGSLHVGHIFSYTHADVTARYRRQRGARVLLPMGYDDNGLPTERRTLDYYHASVDPTLPACSDPAVACAEADRAERALLATLHSGAQNKNSKHAEQQTARNASAPSECSSGTASPTPSSPATSQSVPSREHFHEVANTAARGKLKRHARTVISRAGLAELCDRLASHDERAFAQLWSRLGFSADWSRTYRTSDCRSQRVAQASFVQLLRSGDLEHREAPTLWDGDFQTAVAQAELDDRPMSGAYHHLRFDLLSSASVAPTALRSSSASFVTVATTRPELLPACVGRFCFSLSLCVGVCVCVCVCVWACGRVSVRPCACVCVLVSMCVFIRMYAHFLSKGPIE
jgi:tRNA synthetases class I (I, L, M and V)